MTRLCLRCSSWSLAEGDAPSSCLLGLLGTTLLIVRSPKSISLPLLLSRLFLSLFLLSNNLWISWIKLSLCCACSGYPSGSGPSTLLEPPSGCLSPLENLLSTVAEIFDFSQREEVSGRKLLGGRILCGLSGATYLRSGCTNIGPF